MVHSPTPTPERTGEWSRDPAMDRRDASLSLGAISLPCAFGEYDLLEEIARGGMGVVYRARHRSLDRVVALKMILQGHLAAPKELQRFKQEAKAAAALDHPGIVPLFEIGNQNGQPFFTMPFIPGGGLDARVRQSGPFSLTQSLDVMEALVAAIAHAHEHGIVHRDLKPANILLGQDGRPRVTDFGLVKWRNGGENLTSPGDILGTPAYMAPEQALPGTIPVGPRSDIYSLGGIFYFMLTGLPPFTGSSVTELLLRVIERPPIPPHTLNPTIPPEVETICLRCLAKDPADRYASAEELAQALTQLRSTRGHIATNILPSSAASLAPVPIRPSSSNIKRTLLLGLAALVLPGALVAAMLLLTRTGETGEQLPPQSTHTQDGGSGQGSAGTKQPLTLDAATLAWLEDLENQGKVAKDLKVEFLGANPDPHGVYRLRPGQRIRLSVELAKGGYVGTWAISPDGTITQLYPLANRKENHRLPAGKAVLIPDEDDLVGTPDGRRERLLVLAASEPWDVPRSETEGPYFVFRNLAETQKLQQSLRGLVRVPDFATRLLPFEVAKVKR